MQVLENSPAHRAGLEAYFDFIVSIDGIRLVSVYILNMCSLVPTA